MSRIRPAEGAARQADGESAVAQARRAARIRRVVEETMARRARGEAVGDAEVQGVHTDLLPELARELALLRLIERAREQAGTAPPADHGDPATADGAPRPLAHDGFEGFEVVREAHRGGQGVVYEGVQRSTGRRVAIKVMREGIFGGDEWNASAAEHGLGPRDAARFEREVRILGQLQHPGIVGIIASGVRAGHFYYAMEYVEGDPIDRWVERHRPRPREILALFARVCDAVAAAHVRGIIHRDLKPSNILVAGRAEGPAAAEPGAWGPQPRILDFGLARMVSEPGGPGRMTVTGQFVGSMPWASPEQASGDQSKVDVRTDVYALGVILYQLLTGSFPYAIEGSPRDVLDNILTAPPARPRTIAKGVDEDAEAIVLKCLAKERGRRYQSASELADDLRRLIEGRTVIARPPGLSYQVRAFARRHRPLVIGGCAVLGALVLGLIGTSAGLIEASAARRSLKRERDAALASEREAERGRDAAERQTYLASIAGADAALRALDAGTARARLEAAPEGLRGWEWSHLLSRADRSIGAIPGEYLAGAPTPAGDRIVVIRADSTASLLDAGPVDGSFPPLWTVALPAMHTDDPAWRSGVNDFSRDGRLIALSRGPELFIVESATGRLLRSFAFERAAWGFMWAAFSPDGRHVAANGIEGRMLVWDLGSGSVLHEHQGSPGASGLAYSPDGRFLCIDTRDAVEFLDARTFQHAHSIPVADEGRDEFGQLLFSPDGRHIVVPRAFSPAVLDAETGRVVARCDGHTQRIILSGFAPDGRLITCSWDRTIRLWDTATGRCQRVLLGHTGESRSAGFFAAGTRIISASADRTLRIWDATTPPDADRVVAGETVLEVGTGSGGELLVECAATMRRWRGAAWSDEQRVPLTLAPATHPSFDPAGRRIAYVPDPESLTLHDVQTGTPVWTTTGLGSPVRRVTFAPDGRILAASHGDGSIRVLSAADGTTLRTFPRARYTGARLAFLPGAPVLLVPDIDGALMFCDLETGRSESIADPAIHRSQEMLSVAASPDGRLIASGHAGGVVAIWDAATRAPLRRLTGMHPVAWCVAFSPDGRRLATGSQDRMVRVWDPADGTELLVLRGHTGTVMSVAWTPDGRTLVSGGYDGTVRRWDTP